MSELIEMPKLSDTMETGTLISWLKNVGDSVSSGDMIAEVETDKATMEVECFVDGVILKQYLKAGDSVPVGAPICAIGEKGEAAPEVGSPAKPEAAGPATDTAAPSEKADAPPAVKTEAKSPPVAEPAEAEPAPAEAGSDARIKASPLAKRMAADKGIALDRIQGTGPGGRIVKKDVLAAAEGRQTASVAARDSGDPSDFKFSEILFIGKNAHWFTYLGL